MTKKVLGKGLSALIPDSYVKSAAVAVEKELENKLERMQEIKNAVLEINLTDIESNPFQPRQVFEDDKIEELAESIKASGVIQPIIVKKRHDNKYEIVCGERRVIASRRAGIEKIPSIIKDVMNEDLLEIALIENIQREDLNPVEEAQAYLKLQETRNYSHEEIADKVGKNRTTVINAIRLLKLPEEILQLLIEKRITGGHARTLLSLPNIEYQKRLAKRIIEENLSVRQVEEIVKKKAYHKRPAKQARHIDAQIIDLERKLEEKLGTKVRLFAGKHNGRIEIKYFSLDDLDRILSSIGIHID